MRRKTLSLVGVLALLLPLSLSLGAPPRARACGGFFCGQNPVDQKAERILFAVNPDGTTTMIVQISYRGRAPDFAWVLPLASVPDAASLRTFPQAALNALDANTGPQFQYPEDPDCWDGYWLEDAAAGGPPSASPGVEVHIRQEVGPYDVAVIESEDAGALVGWLRSNGFRVTAPMIPYIRLHAEEGMKFLALRLTPGSDVEDIAPFGMTLPGSSPAVPLRMTSLAAEPEMGVLVFVLGDMRYGPANWPEVTIDDDDIVWRPNTWPVETNWAALVAHGVDDAGGQGWVTEMAAPLAPIRDLVASTTPRDEDQRAAQEALLEVMGSHAYITRLYTRLSAEEMTSDPSFRRTAGGDVDRMHQLPRYVEGRDMCVDWSGWMGGPMPENDSTACDFVTCGAGGLCREVVDAEGNEVAACACVPGATARTGTDLQGRPTVVCQDLRMSFLNPGDRETPDAAPLPDPCVSFSCGSLGRCVPMNMTPTCVCDAGAVAVGSFNAEGMPQTTCVAPSEAVPPSFYNGRLPELPAELPGGREVDDLPPVTVGVAGGALCSASPSTSGPRSGLPFSLAGLAVIGLALLLRRRPGRRA